MKYYVYILLLLICWAEPHAATSQPAELTRLLTTAKQQNKNIFVYVHASWCAPCRELEKNVLPVQTIKDSLENFVFVSTSLDESALGNLLAKKYSLTSVPTFLLLSPSGELLHYQTAVPADTLHFLKLLADYKEKNKRIAGFSTDFSIRYPTFYENLFSPIKNNADAPEISQYLDTQTDLENEVNFNIFRTLPVGSKYRAYFLSHGRTYLEKYGVLYGQRVDRLYLSDISRITREKDTLTYALLEGAHYLADSAEGFNKELLKQLRYILFLGRSGLNWERYILQVDSWVEKYGNSGWYIPNFCDDVYKTCSVPFVCKKMATYLGIALSSPNELNEQTYFKYAVLLHRGGQPDEAIQALEKALALTTDDKQKISLRKEWANQLKYKP
ncbi:MAG TPA: thioredoxin family protein [Puia sp.]|nr:thioredoxin family protein [Puia sp.]